MHCLTVARRWMWAGAANGLLLLGACASTPPEAQTFAPLPDPLTDVGGQPEYRVGAGDLLEVKVFQILDLDREVRVDSGGRIVLPLIGTVQAGGSTVQELQAAVTQRYAARYLQDPQVTILIKEFTSQRITVAGAVDEPGIYPFVGGQLTLQQALATAKGVSTLASRRNVVVFRTVDGQRMLARFDLVDIEHGLSPDPTIYGGDIVVVYRSNTRVVLRTILELTPIVNVWRAYR